jgi:hypothetical protein
VRNPVWVENEYCRILLEEGLVGLLLWIGFIVWFATNRATFVKDDWLIGRRMAWYLCGLNFLVGLIGVGMLSSIPNTFMFLLCVGWTSVRPQRDAAVVQGRAVRAVAVPVITGARAY